MAPNKITTLSNAAGEIGPVNASLIYPSAGRTEEFWAIGLQLDPENARRLGLKLLIMAEASERIHVTGWRDPARHGMVSVVYEKRARGAARYPADAEQAPG